MSDDKSSVITFFCFFGGVLVLALRDGLLALAVFLIGFGVVGELQRKADDIVDAIKGQSS